MDSLISICIPTYNGEKYLQEALDSVKAQTYRNIEVIISDDHSTDGTLEICRRFEEEVDFPVYIYNHIPSGIGANWNNCIKNINGEYVKFLFQDDVLMPESLGIQLSDIQKYGLKAVCSRRMIIDDKSEEITSGDWIRNYGDLQTYLHLPENISSFLFTKRYLSKNRDYAYNIFGEPDTFLYHKSIFTDVGLFNNDLRQIIDLEFSYRILKKYPILIERKKLLKFRLHADQTSNRNQTIELTEHGDLMEWVKRHFFLFLSLKEKLRYLKQVLKSKL